MPATDPAARRARQQHTLLLLATVLIAAGLVVLFFLSRVPWPLRVLIGCGDVIAGSVLFVLVRQKFRSKDPAGS